ncbi:membrane-bound alpha-1,6- mannosyltransferase Initiation-specific [Chytriomyces hyalinus]|nr:membrane-bound alpha-1,6- mannosyltransferase Initiation-specific [Chytriomyces hyalinus]
MTAILKLVEANARAIAAFALLLALVCTLRLPRDFAEAPAKRSHWTTQLSPWQEQPIPNAFPAYPIIGNISRDHSPIPNLVLRTWKTASRREMKEMCQNETDHPERIKWFETWERVNPRATQIIFSDADMETFVKGRFSQRVVEAYFKLPRVVLRADFVRYMMLYELGGVYADMDVSCLGSIWRWALGNPNVAVIVGVEDPGYASHPVYGKHIDSIQQWTMASARHHPFMAKVIHVITENIHALSPEEILTADVLDLTGPGIWKNLVWDHIVGLGGNLTSTAYMYEKHHLYGDDFLVLGRNFLGWGNDGDPNTFITHHHSGFTKFGWRNLGNDVPAKVLAEEKSKNAKEFSASEHHIWKYVPPKMVLSICADKTASTNNLLSAQLKFPKTIVSVSNVTQVKKLPSQHQQVFKSWTVYNPKWRHMLLDEPGMNQFVRRYCTSKQKDAFFKLPVLQQRMELFKFLWLLHKGGIYADLDMECKSRVQDWGVSQPGVGLVLGFKAQHYSLPAFQRNVLASVPNHPVIEGFVEERCSEIIRLTETELSKGFSFHEFFEISFNRYLSDILVQQGVDSIKNLADLDWSGRVEVGNVLIHGNDRFFPSNPNHPSTFAWSYNSSSSSLVKQETLAR